METEIQTVTIFRTWVEIAATFRTDADRGKFYQAICEYSLFGKAPELPAELAPFFTLLKPTIDKSNKRKTAQQKGLQIRLQNKPQNDLQNGLQNKQQTSSQNCTARVRKTETGTVKKKTVSKETAKEKVSFDVLFPYHLRIESVLEKWKEWESFRRKKGKPISENAARMQIEMLSQLTAEEAIAAMNNSIANDYQGLFPPKRMNTTTVNQQKDYTGI